MIWSCFFASCPGQLTITEGTKDSELYKQIVRECELKLNRQWIMQQNKDPKHTSHPAKEWLKQNKGTKAE